MTERSENKALVCSLFSQEIFAFLPQLAFSLTHKPCRIISQRLHLSKTAQGHLLSLSISRLIGIYENQVAIEKNITYFNPFG